MYVCVCACACCSFRRAYAQRACYTCMQHNERERERDYERARARERERERESDLHAAHTTSMLHTCNSLPVSLSFSLSLFLSFSLSLSLSLLGGHTYYEQAVEVAAS